MKNIEKKPKCPNLIASCLTIAILIIGIVSSANAEKHITYLRLGDFSGPIAGTDIPNYEGIKIFLDYINAKGGIDGVKIKMIAVDIRYNVARAVSAYNRYRREKNLFVTQFAGTNIGKAIGPLSIKDKIIAIYSGDGSIQAKQTPYSLNAMTAYQDMFGGSIDWIMEDWKKKGNNTPPVIGYIGWDNPFGKEPLRGGMEYAKTKRVKMLPPEFFPIGTLDHAVYLNRIAGGKANYVIVTAVDPTPTNVIVKAHRMGLTKKMVFLSPFTWSHLETVGMRLHPEEMEGTIAGSCWLKGEDLYNHPNTKKLWVDFAGKPLKDIAVGVFNGMSCGMSLAQALKIALKEVRYEDLTSDIMLKNLKKLGDEEYRDHREGIMGPCTWGPKETRSSKHMKFYQVKKGKLLPITDWRKLPDTVSMYQWK